MANIYHQVLNGKRQYNQLTQRQQDRYNRQMERAGEDHDYMKNLNIAAIPGAVGNVFTGFSTKGADTVWDDEYNDQTEDPWKIASNVLGLGDSLWELAHPGLADPEVQANVEQNKNKIDSLLEAANRGINAGSTNDLRDKIANINYADTNYNLSDFGGTGSAGDTISGIGKAMLKGAQSGSVGGPWGALGGAATGLISGIGAAFTGAKNREADARKLTEELTRKATLANNMTNASLGLANSNIQSQNMRNTLTFALGGNLYPFGGTIPGNGTNFTDGLTFINNGGTHEENPYGGILQGIAQDGQPNLVEEGEVVWNDYVFSNRLTVPEDIQKQLKLGKKDITFADAVKKLQKSAEERPNDPIEQRGLDTMLQSLAQIQETVRAEEAAKEQYESDENTAAMFADGGPIHIAKNKRGTFTAAATKHRMGVQEFASHVLANKDNYSPEMVKKAVFAHNAKGWKHALGGHLYAYGNPPYSLDERFKESLQGTIDRMNTYPAAYWTGESQQYQNNWADANGQWMQDPKEKPINWELAELALSKLPDNIYNEDVQNYRFGDLSRFKNNKNGLLEYAKKGNPGPAYSYLNSLVYNNLNNPAGWLNDAGDPNNLTGTFIPPNQKPKVAPAEIDTSLPEDDYWATPEGQNEFYKTIHSDDPEALANNPYESAPPPEYKPKGKKEKKKFDESWLRYAPVLGSAIGTMISLFDKPDTEYAAAIERAGKEAAGQLREVKPKPTGDYLAYNPFDRLFYANQLGAQEAANRRAILNASAGNVGATMAGLSNIGYNAATALGQLYRQGEEYNLAQRHKVAEFNKNTNQFNSQQDLQAQITNAQTDARRAQILQNALTTAAGLRLNEKNRIAANRSANLTNLFDNLGDIGWEAMNRNMINSNKALYYYFGRNGITEYKGMTDQEKKNFAKKHNTTKEKVDNIVSEIERDQANS